MGINVVSEIAAFEQMEADRATTNATWQSIRDLMQPDDASFLGKTTPGTTNRAGNLDSTAEMAGEITAAALHNSLTNPATRWLDLRGVVGQQNLEDEDKLWLMEATSGLLEMMDEGVSGFSATQKIKYSSTVFYGQAAAFIEEKFGVGAFFQSVPIQEVYVNEGADGHVSEVWRGFEFTAAQAIEFFNRLGDNPGKLVEKSNEEQKTRQDKTKFLHITRPRLKIPPGIGPMSMPVESVYINLSEKTLVRESGFPEWPWSVPRWSKRPGEKNGRGLGHRVLADVKMANRIAGATIESLEKNVDPALQLPDDGVMGRPVLSRGGLNYVRAELFRHGDPIRKVHAGGATALGIDYTNRLDQKIKNGFLNNLLSISDDPRMSATQVVTLDEKQQNILGPIIGAFEAEDLDPTVNRVLGIGIRSGRIAPPPENLQGKPLRVVYTSPLARRRRAGEVTAITRTFQIVAPMAAAKPDVWDNFDLDAAVRIIAEVEGVPAEILRPLKDIAKKRALDAAAAAQDQQMQDAATVAQSAGAAAPALKLLQGGNNEAT